MTTTLQLLFLVLDRGAYLVLGKVYEVDPILFGVDCPLEGAPLAVVDDDLVVLGAGDEAGPVVAEAEVVDRVLVVPKHLAHPHRADHVVHQLHPVSTTLEFSGSSLWRTW